MAKDGTNRGGARPGAGRKPKALKEKLDAGNPGGRPLKRIDIPESLEGVDMPPPGEYLSAMQRDGKPLGADEIYNKVYAWLTRLGCETCQSAGSRTICHVCGTVGAVRRSNFPSWTIGTSRNYQRTMSVTFCTHEP